MSPAADRQPGMHRQGRRLFLLAFAAHVGIEESRRLFDYMMQHSEKTPIVIDSDDLVNHPEAVLKYLCDLIQIPFDGKMLDWSHSKKEADDQLAVFMAWRKWSRLHRVHSYLLVPIDRHGRFASKHNHKELRKLGARTDSDAT